MVAKRKSANADKPTGSSKAVSKARSMSKESAPMDRVGKTPAVAARTRAKPKKPAPRRRAV